MTEAFSTGDVIAQIRSYSRHSAVSRRLRGQKRVG